MIVVTGGSGFIGSHVVDKLKEAGYEVRVIDLKPPHRTDVAFTHVDLLDFEALKKTMRGASYVFHLAAVANINEARKNPIHTATLNMTGTVHVLEAARQTDVERVLFASTEWVYSGSRGKNLSENSPFYMPGAGHLYTSTKIASELICHDYHKLYGQPFTIMRYGIPYGPRARVGTVIPIFLRKALAGEPLAIFGNGEQFRNFVYVEDLAVGNVLCLKPIAQNKTYNLTGDQRITVKHITETLQKLLGSLTIEYFPARQGDYGGEHVSNKLAKHELGWIPAIPFEEGMRRYIAWYRVVTLKERA